MSKDVVEKVLDIFENDWNKQVILYGPPGTSKTYSSKIIAAKFLAERNGDNTEIKTIQDAEDYLKNNPYYKIVQFHPSYSYEDFVRGITVKTNKENGTLEYNTESKIIETFSDFLDQENKYGILVVDEINRAPLASVLGELIYGLENRGQGINTSYSIKEQDREKLLKVSEKLYIIGTMNTADRSIGSIDYAVRRRFAFINVPSSPGVIEGSWTPSVGKIARELYELLIDGVVSDDKTSYDNLQAKDNVEMEYLKFRLEYQIWPIYQEYVKDGLIKQEGGEQFKELQKFFLKKYNDGAIQEPKTKKGIFHKEYLCDQEMDVEDIKIGHTYFLGKN